MHGTTDTEDAPQRTSGNQAGELPQVFIRAEHAAKLLTVTRREIYALMASGDIQSVKLGRRRLIIPSSLYAFRDRLLAEQAVAA